MGEGCPFTHYENTPPCPFDLANQECPSILGCTFSHTMWVNVRRMPRAWVREVVPIAGQEFCDGSGGFGMARGFSRDSQAAVGSFQSSDRGIQTDSGAEIAAGGGLGGNSAIGGGLGDMGVLDPQSDHGFIEQRIADPETASQRVHLPGSESSSSVSSIGQSADQEGSGNSETDEVISMIGQSASQEII